MVRHTRIRRIVTEAQPVPSSLPYSFLRWLKSRAGGGSTSATPAKGVKLFYTGAGGSGGGGKGGAAEEDGKGMVVWPLRLLALGGKGAEATQRVKSSLRHEIK